MSKIYLITFDVDASLNSQLVHTQITSLYPTHISDWWHYMHSSYLVVTNLTATQLYNHISPSMPQHHVLVMEVNHKNYWGWLPQDAWNWLKKHLYLQ